jgi:uncharacterized protein YqfA (UPF0365 family)
VAEHGPAHRRTDLVLMAMLFTFTTASLLLSGLGSGQVVAGVALTVVELAAVPLRRTRPRTASSPSRPRWGTPCWGRLSR